MRTLAEHALNVAASLGAGYADVRVIEQDFQVIETKDLAVSAINLGSSMGAGIRVLHKGGWGFAATQTLTKKSIEQTVRRAVAIAQASASCMRQPVTLAPEPVYNAVWVSPHSKDPFEVSLETK